jgi:hypothetical protein
MHNPETSRPKDEAIDSEATSKETLKDIEETEKVSDDTPSGSSADKSQSPAPDGSLDESPQIKDAGPM